MTTAFHAEKHVLKLFERADVSVLDLESVFLNSSTQEQFAAVKNALESVANFITNLEANTEPKHADKHITAMHDFLKSVADISPSFRLEMESQHLYDLKAYQLTNQNNNAAYVAALRRFLAYALQVNTLTQVQADLVAGMREYYTASAQQTQTHANKLRESIGTANHHHTAESELKDLGARSIENKCSNGMFDPLKVIGNLLSAMHYVKCIAPFDNEFYPDCKFKHVSVSLANDPKMQLNRQMYGGDLPAGGMPGAAPAPAAAPVRAGGPN